MKRLLLLTESWPPDSSGGVQRPLQFARHLKSLGTSVTVLAPQNDVRRFPQDESLLLRVRDIPCHRVPLSRPFTERLPGTARRLLRRWRGAKVPDDFVRAAPDFVEAGRRLHREDAFDAVMTTSPPHSFALMGLALQEQLGLPWIADFRDEWSRNRLRNRHLSRRERARDRELEARCFAQADRVIVTTHTLRDFALGTEGLDPGRVVVIPNGYEPEDLPARPLHRYGDRLVVTYLGTLSSYRRLDGLFAAVRRLQAEPHPFPFQFRFITPVDRIGRHFAAHRDLVQAGVIRLDTYLPHRQALEEAARADVLLHVLSNADLQDEPVAGKLFEYIALARPVLFLTSVRGENERILRETGTGIVADLEDVDEIVRTLVDIRRRWEERTLEVQPQGHEIYERRALTQRLAGELAAVTA